MASFPGSWKRDSHIPTLWLDMTRPHPNAHELIQGAPPPSNLCKLYTTWDHCPAFAKFVWFSFVLKSLKVQHFHVHVQ